MRAWIVSDREISVCCDKRRFEETFHIEAPTWPVVKKLLNKFQTKGQVTNQNNMVLEDYVQHGQQLYNIQRITNKCIRSPVKSVIRISRELHPRIPKSSVQRILKKHIDFFPFHIHGKHMNCYHCVNLYFTWIVQFFCWQVYERMKRMLFINVIIVQWDISQLQRNWSKLYNKIKLVERYELSCWIS